MKRKPVHELEIGDVVIHQTKKVEVKDVTCTTGTRAPKYLVTFNNGSTVTFNYNESLTIPS